MADVPRHTGHVGPKDLVEFPRCTGLVVPPSDMMGSKQDMQALNNKLAYYIEWVRKMKASGSASASFTASSYSEGMRQLEGELVKLKSMYEAELQKLRVSLMEATKEKNKYLAEAGTWKDIKAKLAVEIERSRGLEAQLAIYEKTIAEKTKEITQLKITIKQFQQEAGTAERYISENTTLRHKLSEEIEFRKNLEVKLKQLLEKREFQEQIHVTQQSDLQERVKIANEMIMKMEVKLKKLNSGGGNLPIALTRLREGNMMELRKFQQETEAAYAQSMSLIKRQMSESSSAQAAFMSEKQTMEAKMREYAAKVAEYKSKCAAMAAENVALKKEVESATASSQSTVTSLQAKIVELQNRLMCFTKQFVVSKEAQVSLKTEIDAYRHLLDVESGRMSSRAGSRPVTATSDLRMSTPVKYRLGGKSVNGEAMRGMKDFSGGRLSAMSVPGSPRIASPKRETVFYGKQGKPGWR